MSRNRRPREPNEEELALVISVRHCARELDDMLQGARRKVQKNSLLFAQSGITMLRRAVDSYAELLEKLKLKSRDEIDHRLGLFFSQKDIQDTQDDIVETEGCWRNLIDNIDRELDLKDTSYSKRKVIKEGEPFDCSIWKSLRSVGQCPKAVSVKSLFSDYTSLLFIGHPAYLPVSPLNAYLDEMAKIQSELDEVKLGVVIITWGSRSMVKQCSKRVKTNNPILHDEEKEMISLCGFKGGLGMIWSTENMFQLGSLKQAGYPPCLPPLDADWTQCLHLGGQLLISTADGTPLLLHRSLFIQDFHPATLLVDLGLSCFASSIGRTEEEVKTQLVDQRRYRCPPDMLRVQWEPTSGMYYDPDTRFYYHAQTGYFYEGSTGKYLFWDDQQGCYRPTQELMTSSLTNSGAGVAHEALVESEEDLKPPGT